MHCFILSAQRNYEVVRSAMVLVMEKQPKSKLLFLK